MQYIRGLEHYDNARKTAVTFGKFDGLHKGHMTLVDTVKKLQDKDDVGQETHRVLMPCGNAAQKRCWQACWTG